MKIALLSYDFRIGGAEKTVQTLIPQFLNAGYALDLVLLQRSGKLLDSLDCRANVISLEKKHAKSAVFAMRDYFKMESPDIVISSQTHLNVISVIAKKISRKKMKLILTEQNTISVNNQARGGKEALLVRLARLLYAHADAIAAVSQGAADDLIQTLKIQKNKVHTIYNPIDFEAIQRDQTQPTGNPWLDQKNQPVILAVGRLTAQKNFSLLIDAFYKTRKTIPCRLIILGEGEERANLETKIASYDLNSSVCLPGVTSNPYSWMSKADIFVCSSLYEGFNIAVAEALACGLPVISTDCPHGPGEILDHGRYGFLIPNEDKSQMERILISSLQNPEILPRKEILIERAQRFSAPRIFADYQELIQSL